jgi:hypothetical protein
MNVVLGTNGVTGRRSTRVADWALRSWLVVNFFFVSIFVRNRLIFAEHFHTLTKVHFANGVTFFAFFNDLTKFLDFLFVLLK